MAAGLRLWNGSGQLRLDITDRITRVLWTKALGANSSGSKVVSGFNAANGAVLCIRTSYTEWWYMPHHAWWSGSTVYWEPLQASGARETSYLVVLMYE